MTRIIREESEHRLRLLDFHPVYNLRGAGNELLDPAVAQDHQQINIIERLDFGASGERAIGHERTMQKRKVGVALSEIGEAFNQVVAAQAG